MDDPESAMERATRDIHEPEDAARVLDEVERAAGDLREEDVAGDPPPTAGGAAGALTEAAAAASEPTQRGDQAAERATAAVERTPHARGRDLLRRELLRRLGPVDKVDTALYLVINRLPHPPLADDAFRRLSWWMTGGHLWAVVPAILAIREPRRGWQVFLRVMPALWVTTAVLEYPVKRYFRRRRPFIDTVQAIVVGRRPGSYSWPSGHTAAAFAGAMLLAACLPRQRPLFRALAAAVGFSRIYLGAHYPGDVASGAVLGMGLARVARRLLRPLLRPLE